jgi:hypothetical protein
MVVAMIIHHLRHQQVEGGEGYRESYEIKHRRRLEATRHVKHVSEDIHNILFI